MPSIDERGHMDSTTASGQTTTIAQAILQVIGTCLILAFIPGNNFKLVSFFLFWAISFGRLSKREWFIFALTNALFTCMNMGALTRGIFVFTQPDILSIMPIWELFMWSFYVIHSLRLLRGCRSTTDPKLRPAIACAILYSIPFSVIRDPQALLIVTSILLLLTFALFHERQDLVFSAYFVALGAAIEYTGVLSGQWYYPAQPYSRVPLWFVTMWGGVGLFVGRILS